LVELSRVLGAARMAGSVGIRISVASIWRRVWRYLAKRLIAARSFLTVDGLSPRCSSSSR